MDIVLIAGLWLDGPRWGPFDGPDSADLGVPVVLVCPEFTPAEAREWIDAGDVPELAKAEHLDVVDIDSGHWPMLTKPVDLARLLAAAASAERGSAAGPRAR